jgi:hypothetical protein
MASFSKNYLGRQWFWGQKSYFFIASNEKIEQFD